MMHMMMAAVSSVGRGRSVNHLFGLLLLSAFSIGLVRSDDWSYSGHTGPDYWSAKYPNCAGQNQSPIDIESQSATYTQGLDLVYTNYDQPITGTFTVTNNGHSVQVTIPRNSGITIYIDHNGFLPINYTLAQFHFHWGSDDSAGSEHSIDRKFYPMEIHLVHYNSDVYPDFATAVDKSNGLVVLGILVKLDDMATAPAFDELTSHFRDILHHGDETTMSSFNIRSLLPASNQDFFRYSGSLTTPPCYESVIWSVFRSPVKITGEQIKRFRALHSNAAGEPDEDLVNNARPIQPLNCRPLFRSA